MVRILIAIAVLTGRVWGQECGIVYVTPNGASSGVAGTRANPANLTYGLQLAGAQNPYMRLAVGNYTITQPLDLKSDVTIEGGYLPSQNWAKTNADSSVITRTSANMELNPPRLVGLRGQNISNFRLQDVRVVVQSTPANTPGASIYGIHLSGCSQYVISRCRVRTGNATPGINGVDGIDGRHGAHGANGGLGCGRCQPGTPPYVIDGGAGGNSWSGGANRGGNGGNGGDRGTGTDCNPLSCNVCDPAVMTAPNGQNGQNGTGIAPGTGGIGRPGHIVCFTEIQNLANFVNGCPSNDTSIHRGRDGTPGANGVDGVDGLNGVVTYNAAGFYVPADGADGTDGTNGSGGGGGGGGASVGGVPSLGQTNVPFYNIDPRELNSAGGGGGGGGEGGERGTKGTKGTGGGANFAIFLHNNGPDGVIKDCSLQPGQAGAGGQGGRGGRGGNGGNGGRGGNATLLGDSEGTGCNGGAGGNGGNGGRGGRGGNGGNGTTGPRMQVRQDPDGHLASVFSQYNPQEVPITVRFNGCANTPVEVSTTSTAASLIWYLGGEAGAATGQNVSTTYPFVSHRSLSVLVNGIPFPYTDFVYVFRPFDKPEINASSQTICAGSTINFSTAAAAETYAWTFPGGNPGVSNAQNPGNVTFNAPGLYPVRLQTSTLCCGTSKTDTLWVRVLSAVEPNLADGATLCRQAPRPILTPTLYEGATVSWTFNGTPLLSTGQTLQTNDAGTYTVNVSYGPGCSGSDSFVLNFYDSLEVDLGPEEIVLCGSEPDPVFDAGPGATTYLWTRNGNLAAQSRIIIADSPGLYEIVKLDEFGCAGTSRVNVVRSEPFVNLGPDRAFCTAEEQNYLDAGNAGAAYEWTLNGTPLSDQRRVYPTQSGVYRVKIITPVGCEYVDEVTLGIETPTNAQINYSPAVPKVGQSVQFIDQSSPAPAARLWNFADGATSTQANPTHVFQTPGLKPVFLIAGTGLCADTAFTTINVEYNCQTQMNLRSRFEWTPNDVDLVGGGLVRFFNATLPLDKNNVFFWDFGDGNVSYEKNPVHAYSVPGEFVVTLITTNHNCSDTVRQTVVVYFGESDRNDRINPNVSVYPNPVRDVLTLKTLRPVDFRLDDVYGKNIVWGRINDETRVDVSHLSSGVYVLSISGGGAPLKIVKQ